MHIVLFWIFLVSFWQFLRQMLIVCDVATMLAIKGNWWVTVLLALLAGATAGWWVALLLIALNVPLGWLVYFYLPQHLSLRYEANLQAYRFVDEMRKRMR